MPKTIVLEAETYLRLLRTKSKRISALGKFQTYSQVIDFLIESAQQAEAMQKPEKNENVE